MMNIIKEKRHCIIKTRIALNGDAIATENNEKIKNVEIKNKSNEI